MKKKFYGFLSLLIPFILLTAIFSIKRLFTDNTIISGDAFAQYYPLFNYLKGIYNGTNSIFYTFYKNLGGSMFGTFFYYLSSPFNVFIKFVNVSNIPLFMTWLIIIKMSLCSFTMYLFMTYRHKTSNLLILSFSVCYGLMGYNINFFVNTMWLDVVIMTPIVLIGLEKLINMESPLLYVVSLFISIFCNYYISYMLCLFCVIYFIYRVLLMYNNKEDRIFIFKRFIITSLLTGLMCSFFLLPCIFESRNYLRSLDINSIFSFDYNLFDIFSKTFIGSTSFKDLLNYSSMNLYCGIVVIPLVYLYLVNENIPRKTRRLTLYLILFMILPCFIFSLNYVWHLFSSPNFYSYRFSFLLCFFIINIAYESCINMNINKLKTLFFLAVYSVISFYFVLITSFGEYYDFLNYKMIWLTLIFLFIYFIILKYNNNKFYKILLSCLLLIENVLNIGIVFSDRDCFSSDELVYSDYKNIIDKYKIDDGRIEFANYFTVNDSLLMEYYGINNFLSTSNNKVMSFFTKMSFKQQFGKQNIYSYNRGQYVLDAVIGLRYVFSTYKIDGYNLLEKIELDDKTIVYVYENPNYMGIGYIIKDECNAIEYGFKYDEKVFNCIFDTSESYYKEYEIKKNENEFNSIIKDSTDFYLYYPEIVKKEIEFDAKVLSSSKNYLYVENNIKNYNFKFTIRDDIDIDNMKIYSFDFKKFKSSVKANNKEKFNYKIFNDKIIGNINTNGGILMVTIPYESGYIIKVDGEKVNYKEVLDTFVGIDLSEGNHELVIEYAEPYLKTGIVISIVSFSIIVFYVFRIWHKKKN